MKNSNLAALAVSEETAVRSECCVLWTNEGSIIENVAQRLVQTALTLVQCFKLWPGNLTKQTIFIPHPMSNLKGELRVFW